MKCPDCGEPMRYTRCNAPGCTAYGCPDCDRGCDLPWRPEVLGRCANTIADSRTEAWQPTAIGTIAKPLLELVAAGALAERQTVIRTGEREPIPPLVRRGVWLRDRGRCQLCGSRAERGELDHVIAWSAGGTDRSNNLRLACQPCNQERSNFTLPADIAMPIPVATSCRVCSPDSGLGRLIEVFCVNCRRRSSSLESNTI